MVANVGLGVVNSQPQKKSNIGTKIGAGLGLAAGVARVIQERGRINEIGDQLIRSGYPKGAATASKLLGIVGAVALMSGVGALIGKGIQKVVNHFQKDKPKGVIPGKNPNPANVKPDADLIEKYGANAKNIRTVTTKDKEEYVIINGHPKKIYKKNPETGELEYKNSVYDGSWGPELSDEDLIESVKNVEKIRK